MNDCRMYGEKLSAYLEGALPEAERREVGKHLETCGDCRAVLQDLKKTGDLLAGLEEKEPPPWFTQQVMARVREEAGERKGLLQKLFFPLRIKIPIEVAASLLVAVLAWQVYQASPPEMKTLPETPTSPQFLQREPAEKNAEQEITARSYPPARERKETGESVVGKMEAPSEGSGPRELKRQEEAVPASRPAETPATEEKKTSAADKAETARPAMAPLKKSEPEEARPAPAPAFQTAHPRMEGELKEKDEARKLETFRGKLRAAGKAAPEIPVQVLTVRVREVDPALKKVRELLRQVGAEDIREETKDGRIAISGVVRAGDLDLLTGPLKATGEVSHGEVPAPALQVVRIRIEIFSENP